MTEFYFATCRACGNGISHGEAYYRGAPWSDDKPALYCSRLCCPALYRKPVLAEEIVRAINLKLERM